MTRPDIVLMLPAIAQTAFVFALGASVGSLINVLVYRIPRGLSVVTPPSRCPACDARLTWRENIPILGWIILRGRCRFCSEKISPEYPIVETIVAALFAIFYLLWYVADPHTEILAIPVGAVAPAWTGNGVAQTWPAFVAILVLLAALVAMTIIDARTCTIPLVLVWTPAAAALLLHTAHAAWFQLKHGPLTPIRPGLWITGDGTRWVTDNGWLWTIPIPNPHQWGWIGAAIGGVLAIPFALALLKLGLIRRSFADYDQWEKKALEQQAQQKPEAPEDEDPHNAAQLWIQYPHARREMFIESAFVAPIVLGMFAGAFLARTIVSHTAGPWQPAPGGGFAPPIDAPLWLAVLAGVCMGYLIGGGVVWAVRIFGSLAFGKEAMGMGDVHLMAAVGASLGWIDAVLGFFGAAFVALAWALISPLLGRRIRRAMPFGPFLAIATVLVLLARPLIEIALGRILGSAGPIDLP